MSVCVANVAKGRPRPNVSRVQLPGGIEVIHILVHCYWWDWPEWSRAGWSPVLGFVFSSCEGYGGGFLSTHTEYLSIIVDKLGS